MRRLALIVIGCVALACDGTSAADGGVDAGAAGALAVFDLERNGSGELLSVPYPSDLYRDADGVVVLGAIPGARERPAFDAIRRLAALRGGFCTTCGAHFGIEGEIDPMSVPASVTGFDEASLDDAVILMDVDPDSPELGRLFPLQVHHSPGRGVFAIRPAAGVVLAGERLYAAVLTDSIRAADGTALRASTDFLAVRDEAGGSPAVQRARGLVGPVLEALEARGVPRERIVALAPFTTADASRDLRRAHEIVNEGVPSVARVDRVISGTDLDDLLGVPADPGPGIDAPPMTGTEGTRAIGHETTMMVVTGTFDAPRIVEGSGTDVGASLRGGDGALVAGPREPVPFMLIVPRGAALDQLPVALSLHGFNASRITGFALADTAGRAGTAVLAIDHYQHGERAASAVDEMHAMRGDVAGADGFAETSPLDVSARIFGYSGVDRGTELSPEYSVGSLLQFASDAMAALRLLRDGDLSAVRGAAPELAPLAFDPDRLFVIGNSLGAEITTLVLSVDRGVAGAVLDVWPGAILDNLVDSPEFRPIVESLFLPQLGVEGPFDEPARGLSLDLVIDLVRFTLEPADPLSLSPHLLGDPLEVGPPPDLLVQLGELDEVAAPRASEGAVASAGIPSTEALRFAPTETVSLPAQANVGGATVVCIRYPSGGHGMMELRSQESRYVPPAVPPLERRSAPLAIDNPIALVHEHIEQLLRTRTADERARIGD